MPRPSRWLLRTGKGVIGSENELVINLAESVASPSPRRLPTRWRCFQRHDQQHRHRRKHALRHNTYTGTTTVNAGTMTSGPPISSIALPASSSMAVALGLFNLRSKRQLRETDRRHNLRDHGNAHKCHGFRSSGRDGSGILAGGVGVNKTTSGTVILSGTNSYTGITTITPGLCKSVQAAQCGLDRYEQLHYQQRTHWSSTGAAEHSVH